MVNKVAEVMTPTPTTIDESTPFKAIAELFITSSFAALPVVDEAGQVLGIVTESDLLLKEGYPSATDKHHLFEGRRRRRELEKAAGLVARDIMSAPAVTIAPQASIGDAARLLHDRRINQLPVVDEARNLIGIVTRGDLLKTFLCSDAELVREVREGILVKTLWMEPDAIAITSNSGVVGLRGTVDRLSDVRILVRMVRNLSGVVGIVNELAYRMDDTRSTLSSPGVVGAIPPLR